MAKHLAPGVVVVVVVVIGVVVVVIGVVVVVVAPVVVVVVMGVVVVVVVVVVVGAEHPLVDEVTAETASDQRPPVSALTCQKNAPPLHAY